MNALRTSRTALLAALVAAGSAAAQLPLSVDTTFRAGLPSQNVYSVLPLADGKVIISGQLQFSDLPNQRAGARLLPNGLRDPSFNQGFLPMGGKLTAWSNKYYSGNGQGLRRFLMNGSIDTDFNFIGQWQQISALQGGDYHVYSDGSVLLGGYYDIIDPAHGYYQGVGYNLAWITAEGRLDTTRTHRTGNGAVFGIKEYPAGTAGGLGGKFLVHQWGTQYEGQPVSKVIRVHADGSLDNSFNAPIPWGYIYDMLPLPDGRAYIAGEFRLENGNDTIQLVRLMPDGSLDPAFNNDLAFEIDTAHLSNSAGVLDVLDLGNGLLALAGDFSSVDGHIRGGLCIIDTTGAVVTHYLEGAGCGNYDYQLGLMTITYGVISGIARAPSGDYYIWGAYHGYSDGTTNDTLQRMVTRLHGGEIGLGVVEGERAKPGLRLSIKPNPANAWVVFTCDLPDLSGEAQLIVRDMMGREAWRASISRGNGQVLMDTSGLPAGAYVAELLQEGQRLLPAERLIVQP